MVEESIKYVPLPNDLRAKIIRRLLKDGYTKKDLAHVLSVTVRTINRWLIVNH
jgi:transposase